METRVPDVLPAEAPTGKQGCARNVLIGCGVLALLLLAVVVGLLLYVRSNPAFLTDLMMRQIESHYASDVTEQDKADLRAAYAEFRNAVSEKRVSRTATERIQVTLSRNRSNQIDREQVHALTGAFREASTRSQSAPPSSGSPAPAPTRSP